MVDGILCAFEGRLGADPETRWLPTGSAVLHFPVVPNDSKAPEGAAEWIRVSVFTEKLTPAAADKLAEGVEVYIEGRLQLGRWQAQDGTPRAGLRVNAWLVQPMGVASIGRRRGIRRNRNPPMPQAMAISG